MKTKNRRYTDDFIESWAWYMYRSNATVREVAKKFNVGKSTVHYNMLRTLPYINQPLYKQIKILLQRNKDYRAMRGGNANALKWQRIKIERALKELEQPSQKGLKT